jgi:hypothetical protein
MSHICQNCGNHFEGKFCNNCGQPAHIHNVNAGFIWHDLQHGLFHYDKGLLYTQGQLLLKPGYTIKEYINGKRIRHFAPVSMVVVMATLYGLFYHYLHINTFKYSQSEIMDYEGLNEWIGAHYAIFTLITIPYYALFSYLFFKKHRYNFSEHIVLNSFLASQRLCVGVISVPFLYYAGNAQQISAISFVVFLADLFLAYRAFSQFFDNLPRWKTFLVTTSCYVVSLMVMSICIAVIIVMLNS